MNGYELRMMNDRKSVKEHLSAFGGKVAPKSELQKKKRSRSQFLSACGGLSFALSGLKMFVRFVTQGVALG